MSADNVQSMRHHVPELVKGFFEKFFPERANDMAKAFRAKFEGLLVDEYSSEVEGLQNIIVSIKPAIASVLEPCEEYDMLMTMMLSALKASWEGAHRRETKPAPAKKGPVLPGSDQSTIITFHCGICGKEIDVPYKEKMKILSSEEEVSLPTHCGQAVRIKISSKQDTSHEAVKERDEPIVPIEMVMGYVPAENVEYLKILSVGIDIGSSTSHLIFSRLTLKRETSFFNMSNRFNLVKRHVIYRSNIVFTPLLDRYTIDIDAVVEFCQEEYRKAGLTREMVDTGAVIVTGETAKKQNAAEIVDRLSSDSGKFVSAAAGPNLESLFGAMGSGIVEHSLHSENTVLHVDIGGGTSNLAIVANGQVLSTSCINVGGRLLGIDKDFKIWRIDGPSQFVMKELGMDYKIGDTIPVEDARAIAREYAKALIEVMLGPAKSAITKELMMTRDLDFSCTIDAFSFSGGVAELFYGSDEFFDDIGAMLAEEIKSLVRENGLNIIEPENKIRATVIGAGSFSLSVSGSTTFSDKDIELPVSNIPVLPVNLGMKEFTPEILEEEIQRTFMTFDMIEGSDTVALYFKELIYSRQYTGDEWLAPFAKGIEKSLPNSVLGHKMIILIFAYDVAKRLGLAVRDETSIQHNILVIDELELKAGDWIDIGAPLKETGAFPVTVKSLIFSENKEYS